MRWWAWYGLCHLLHLGAVRAALLLVIFVALHPLRDASRLSRRDKLAHRVGRRQFDCLAIGLLIAACWATGHLAIDRRLATAAAARGPTSKRRKLAFLPDHAHVRSAFQGDTVTSATQAIALYALQDWLLVPRGWCTQTLLTKPEQHPLIMGLSSRRLANSVTPGALWRRFVEGVPIASEGPGIQIYRERHNHGVPGNSGAESSIPPHS
jgi:hypothetical protein